MQSQPAISVIVPVRNGASHLTRSLGSIRKSTFCDYELIVVDDCSTDESPAIIERFEPQVRVRNEVSVGAFQSRNIGARHARADVLFFTDADVELRADTLEKIATHFDSANMGCLIGLYSEFHPHRGISSQYKNAWIRFSYLQSPTRVSWFTTAVGAVRRSVWEKTGGFDPDFQVSTGGGDIEFGRRLDASGVRILLDKGLEVVHLKHYSMYALAKNQVLRAYGWTRFALATCMPLSELASNGMANASPGFATSSALALVLVFLVGLSFLYPPLAASALAVAVGYVVLNRRFISFLRTRFGLLRMLHSLPVMYLDHLACSCGATASLFRIALPRLTRNVRNVVQSSARAKPQPPEADQRPFLPTPPRPGSAPDCGGGCVAHASSERPDVASQKC